MKMRDGGKKMGVGGNLVEFIPVIEKNCSEISIHHLNEIIMALVQLGCNIQIVSLKDGIQNLVINDSLVLPKAYEEDLNALKEKVPQDRQFGGLAIQVIKITLESEIKYHPAIVAIDIAEQPISSEGNWVILVCPPGDRGDNQECLQYKDIDQLMAIYTRKSSTNSND